MTKNIQEIPGIKGKGHRFLTKSFAISLLATFIGLSAGIALAIAGKKFSFDHLIWVKLTQRGVIPYLITGFFAFGQSYLILAYLFRCFPTIGNVNIYERRLIDTVLYSQTVPLGLNELLQQRPLGGIHLLHTRLSKLWNGFVRGASPTDLRSQNESLSDSDENSLHISIVPLDISMWAMPVLGFIGTVWGAGGAVKGLASAIINVVAVGQLNESTIPFLEEAFGGLSIAFDTTLCGLTGLIIVGFGRWAIFRTGLGAITYVDNISEDFISLISYSRGGGYSPDPEVEIPLNVLPNRISRMALDVWRAGHDSKQFIEERVIEGISPRIGNIVALAISAYPHYVMMVEKRDERTILKSYHIGIGPGDGLFVFMQPLSMEELEIDSTRLRPLALNNISLTGIFPLSDTKLGILSFGQQGTPHSFTTAAYFEGTLVETCNGYLQSDILNAVRLVLSVKVESENFVAISKEPVLPGQDISWDWRPGQLLASDSSSYLIAVSQQKNKKSTLTIFNCAPDSQAKEVLSINSTFTHCRFAPEQGYLLAISEDQEIHYAQYEATLPLVEPFKHLISCKGEVTEVGLLGSQSDSRLLYLMKNGELYSIKIPRDGKKVSKEKLILSDCRAMALSEDGKHLITYQNRDGLRSWGYRMESA